MAHSTSDEQLVSFRVVDQPHVDHCSCGRTFSSAADHAERWRIARSGEFVDARIMVAQVSHPEFLVFQIYRHSSWILDPGLWSSKDSDGSDVRVGIGFEHEN